MFLYVLKILLVKSIINLEYVKCKFSSLLAFLVHSSDALNDQQVWKTQPDMTIFKKLSDECNNFDISSKSTYIKFNLKASSVQSSSSTEAVEDSEKTKESDQVFLETSV